VASGWAAVADVTGKTRDSPLRVGGWGHLRRHPCRHTRPGDHPRAPPAFHRATLPGTPATQPPYRDAGVSRATIAHAWRADGTLLMRALDEPVAVSELGFSGYVPRWAATRGATFSPWAVEGNRMWL